MDLRARFKYLSFGNARVKHRDAFRALLTMKRGDVGLFSKSATQSLCASGPRYKRAFSRRKYGKRYLVKRVK